LTLGANRLAPSTELGDTPSVAQAGNEDASLLRPLLNDLVRHATIQAWSNQPLGPFQAQAFANSISAVDRDQSSA